MESGLYAFTMLNEDLHRYYKDCSEITKSSQNIEEKNKYFDHSNEYGVFLINSCRYQEAEIFYSQCLDIIKAFEDSNKITLSKGMPLVNLGISQIGIGKIEEGISNIISSYNDDKKYYENPKYEKFYLQFENQIVEKVLFLFIDDDSVNDYSEKYRDFIKSLGYKIENRLFQFLILNKIYSSYNSYKNNNDISSKLVLFNTLRDQCLLIEQILRDKGIEGRLYSEILKNAKYIKDGKNCSSIDISKGKIKIDEFNNEILNKLNSEDDKNFFLTYYKLDSQNKHYILVSDLETKIKDQISDKLNFFDYHLKTLLSLIDEREKIFKLSLCIRNFNNHHFDISSKVLYDNISEIIKLTIIKAGKIVGEKMILMMNK